MNIDDPDLTPAGASLRVPVTGPHGQPVATFSAPRDLPLDEIWHGRRTNDVTLDGQQGSPLGYQPGRSIEHEPLDRAERDSQRTAQNAYSFTESANQIRSAMRPVSF